MNTLICIALILLSAPSFAANDWNDEDWQQVTHSLRMVNITDGMSSTCTIWKNTINGKLAAKPADNEMLYYLDWSTYPGYRMMFEYKYQTWYVSPPENLRIPDEGDYCYVKLVRAVCYTMGRSGYYRLLQNKINGEYIIRGRDPMFGSIVYDSDWPDYSYMFQLSGFTWYFNL